MNISTLLNDLFARGVTLWPDGTDLGLRGAKELLTPGLLSTLKAHKGEILQALAHGSETFPLTHGQWAFWYEEQLATGRGGERTTYHVSLALRIHAPLNPAAMQRALQMLVNRHPMLRTTFADIDGKLAQLVHQYQEVTFTTVDMRDEAWTAVHKQLQEAHAQPFDLELGPLFRTKLFHCAANDYVLICSAHHIVCDGLSLWLIMDELPVLYTIAATGHGKPPLPHSAHYADYVTWQRDLLAEKGDELLAFWRQQLAHAPTLLTLPTDFPRPAMRTYAGASQPLALSPQLTRQLRDVARAEGVTLYMLLLAAYQLLLRCYTGQIDILVESRMSGRAKAEFYTLVGNFFSPVVLRAHMPGNLTLREFLRQVRQTTVASLKHQDYPFSRLVEQLPIVRDPARSPLVQVSFGLNKPYEQAQQWRPLPSASMQATKEALPQGMLGEWLVTPLPISLLEGMYELDLQMLELEQQLVGRLSYNTNLFAPSTIARMAANFETVLVGIVQDPSRPIGELPMLAAAERQQLLIDWNATVTPPIQGGCIHTRFEEQAARTPDADALVLTGEWSTETKTHGDMLPQSLSYRELNERANQLAHHLRASGVGPGILVGIALPPSFEMIVALLAILKAGGAYVPLDPNYPAARLQQMIDEAEITLLITQEPLRDQLSAHNQTCLSLDAIATELRQLPPQNPVPLAQPTDLIYTIFTSGSTGKPKGAGVYHRGFANLLDWYIDDLGLTAADRLLLVTSLSFDLTQKNIFAPLLTGGVLYLAPQSYFDPTQLCHTIKRHAISWINCTPSIFYHLTDADLAQGATACASLRTVVLGGEPIHRARLHAWLGQPGRTVRLVNSYGPTECTDVCAAHMLDTGIDNRHTLDTDDATAVPIGRPIRNVQLYVLDEEQHLAPIGVAGELCIGGAGVGAGYRNDAPLTEARFITNSFISSPTKERIYRTGDTVKYLPDGNLLFLGRMDNQVKVRGMRVEVGEIESTLGQHPLVQQVVVTQHQPRRGEERLIAYVVPKPDLGLSTTVDETATLLRAYLTGKLPPHMVPATILLLDALPLTPSGKVDRHALPTLDAFVDQIGDSSVEQVDGAPRTPLEEELAALWAEELGVTGVDIHARLFALGGDSFTAVRLISRLKERGLAFSLRQLMEAPTVAAVASALEKVNSVAEAPAQHRHPNSVAKAVPQRNQAGSSLGEPHPSQYATVNSTRVGSTPMTGDDYLASLRDGRDLWIYGERVADVTVHPAFRNQARMVARLYDELHRPEMRQTLTCPSDLDGIAFTHPYFRASYTQDEVLASRDALVAWLRIGYGWMGRAPDYMAGLMGMLGPNAELYAPFDANARRMYADFQQRMPYVNHAFVNPPVDRDRPPDEVADVYIHVVCETDAGLIISGAKNITTNAALTNYSFVGHDGGVPVRNQQFAATFLLPMNSPGLKIICRPSYEMMAASFASPFDYPLSARFDENDAILILDEVLVPWENVLIYGDLEKHNKHIHNTGFHPRAALQSATRLAVKLDLIAGLLLKATEATGVAQFRGVQAQVGEVLTWRHLFWTLSDAMAHSSATHRGALIPKTEHLMAHRLMMTTGYPRVKELIAQLVASGLIFHPSSARDFQTPELRPYLDKYMRGSTTAALDRTQLMKTLWDAVGTEFGGRHDLYERNNMGSHEAIRLGTMFQSMADGTQDALKAFAERCLGEVDLDGWTAPDLINSKPRSQPTNGHSRDGADGVARDRHTATVSEKVAPTQRAHAQQIEQADQADMSTILPAVRGDTIPLSRTQQSLWLLEQIEPGNSAYNEIIAVRMGGPLQLDTLNAALTAVVERHEILRTTFAVTEAGEPTQVINPPSFTFSIHNLSHLSEAQQTVELQELARHEAHTLFDLAHGPLLRVTLCRLKSTPATPSHALIIAMHHLICDGWSMGLLLQDIYEHYLALAAGRPLPLPPLPIQYADYAIWQQAPEQRRAREDHLAYWQSRLADSPTLLQLPTDRPRPARQCYDGSCVHFTITSETTAELRALAQQTDTTLFMVLLTVFKVLLARYSGQEDIVVGVPIANRQRAEVASLIGFFVNTIALRTQLTDNPTFLALLAQVKETTQDAYIHQDIDFASIVSTVQPERDPSYSPLFQVMFALHNMPTLHTPAAAALTVEPVAVDLGISKYDLSLEITENADGLAGLFEYSTDLFDRETIERMVGHWQTLLQSAIAAPEETVARLPLLTDCEHRQLLTEWASRPEVGPIKVGPVSLSRAIHQRFAEHAANTPDALAITLGDKKLTYHELNQRANQLAHQLHALGVTAETPVGLCVERSLDMVVGLLAILKAGGVHVPLDPSFPTERLAYMMQDAQIALLLTQETLASSFANQSTPLICLESAWPQIAKNKDKNPTTPVKPHQLAYIIYTSGSTGQPKGVMVDHAALAGHIDTVIDLYNVTSADRVLQFAAITFDVALEQIFLALGSGATLVMRGTDLWTPPEFDQQVLDHAITVADLPPVYFHQLVQYWQTARPTFLAGQLRLILVGGEKTTPETVKLWQELGAVGTKLLNAYGPTETTITAAICDLSAYPLAETTSALSNLPIGRPLPNRSVYILDTHLQPTPIGVPGELYIGGAGLAHGYLNKPALTTENFIPNPFAPSERPGRLYRTGDLVRWIAEPDGSEENSPIIEFLGRVDHQVKIRGFRIEPGEIEAVLTQHPEVQEAVVVAQGNQSNEQQLVAYVILDIIIDESNPQLSSALSQYLQQTLPAYMIPAHFVVLDALPMTPAGKIDRGSLPAPKPTSSTVAHKSPDTETEEILAAIWRELLNLQAISIHDNFFHHGGNSILSLQVVSHAHRAGLQLQPKDIFLYPTIAQLARIVGQDTEKSAPQIAADPVTGSAPLTPIQQWFFDHHTIDIHHHNQSMIFALRPGLDVVCLQQALQQLLDHHDALRTRFIPTDNGWQQLYLSDDKLSFHQIDLARLSAPEQAQCLATEADRLQASLNLTAGPLMEVALFTYGTDQPAHLLWVLHHLIVDGVSWRILLEDLIQVYNQLMQGHSPKLPVKTTSYQEWAIGLTTYAQSEHLAAEVAYWSALDGQVFPTLPVDYPEGDGENRAGTAQHVICTLSETETHALLRQAPATYQAQINDLLLTALARTLCNWTSGTSVWLDLEGHGREVVGGDTNEMFAPNLSRTVGWFTTIFPVVLHWSPQTHPAQEVAAIQAQLRRIPQRGIGFGLLRYLKQEDALAELPAIQVCFNYLGEFDHPMSAAASAEMLLLPDENLMDVAIGSQQSPQQARPYLLDINGWVKNGRLHINWIFSQNFHQDSTIRQLANEFMDALRVLIAPSQILRKVKVETATTLSEDGPVRSSFCREDRPLLALFETGDLPSVDAVSLRYVGDENLQWSGLSREDVMSTFEGLPLWTHIIETPLGRLGDITLPRLGSELYTDAELETIILAGLKMAGRIGANVVSLLGLLPSATEYGERIARAMDGHRDLPQITTGHATTAAAVILNMERILAESERVLEREHVGFVGLGSVGRASLQLMLRTLPHPRAITLCDVFDKIGELKQLRRKMIDDFHYQGKIHIAVAHQVVPNAVYKSSFIVGATSVPNVLDVAQLQPGTLVVDDSAPHCFNPTHAIARLESQHDILFTEGGIIRFPQPPRRITAYVQPMLERVLDLPQEVDAGAWDTQSLASCMLSGLLSSHFPHLPPSIGSINVEECIQHYELLKQLAVKGTALCCLDMIISPESIQSFRQSFGGKSQTSST